MPSNRDRFRKALDARRRQQEDRQPDPPTAGAFDRPAHWHRRQGRRPVGRRQGRRSS